jgi:hypothetical protein
VYGAGTDINGVANPGGTVNQGTESSEPPMAGDATGGPGSSN